MLAIFLVLNQVLPLNGGKQHADQDGHGGSDDDKLDERKAGHLAKFVFHINCSFYLFKCSADMIPLAMNAVSPNENYHPSQEFF